MSTPKPLKIFFSVGEPSGDLHAANLIRQLRQRSPGLQAVGYGGPQMAAAGCELHADLTQLAVMWFARALANLHKFWDLASRADRYFRHHKPDAVVLVDYPGFNWWIARRAKVHGIPVFYYTPPQIWAWATWRAKKMRRLVDHALCSLPFEEPWLQKRGCNATFVGHPFFDEVRRKPLDDQFLAKQQGRGGPLVTILPGSRTQEVVHNLPWFLKAAEKVRQEVPGTRFAIAAFKPKQAAFARQMAEASGQWEVIQPGVVSCQPSVAGRVIEIHTGRTPELMHLADSCMACSGSVSLELLYHAKPTVILYWISRPAYFVQGFFRKVKYITLVNLLANEGVYPWEEEPEVGRGKWGVGSGELSDGQAEDVLFPEYLTCEDKSAEVARHVIEWLRNPAKRAARVKALEQLRARVGHGGASERAAEYMLAELGRRS